MSPAEEEEHGRLAEEGYDSFESITASPRGSQGASDAGLEPHPGALRGARQSGGREGGGRALVLGLAVPVAVVAAVIGAVLGGGRPPG